MATSSRSVRPPHLRSTRRAHQAVRLQDLQVVVDLLPALAHAPRQLGGRGGLGQLRQQRAAYAVQRGGRGGGLFDDFDIEHEDISALTGLFVKPDR